MIGAVLLLTFAFFTGLIMGFFGWLVYDRVNKMFELFKDRLESPPGVVRPQVSKITRNQPRDLSLDSEAGPVMRPSPTQIVLENLKEREERARSL